jgi:DNA-binding transcriptional LysR family regulator
VLYGGARCTPGCRCYGEAWVYQLAEEARKGSWLRVNVTGAAPVHRYRHALVRDASDGSFYLFGGESYRPYMYHNALDRLQIAGLSGGNPRAADRLANATSIPAGEATKTASMLPAVAAGMGVSLLAFWLIRKLLCAPREPIR